MERELGYIAYVISNSQYDNVDILGKTIKERCMESIEVVGAKVEEIKTEKELPKTGRGMVILSSLILGASFVQEILEKANSSEGMKFADVGFFGDLKNYNDIMKKEENDISSQNYIKINKSRDITDLYQTILKDNVNKHMNNGVIFFSPNNVVIEDNVIIAPGVQIHGNVAIRGLSCVNEGTVIYEGTDLNNAEIGKCVVLKNAKIQDSSVGDLTTVGPFAFIRGGTKIGSKCRLGDYVEIKNSTLGDEVKMAHLAYVGDAEVGARTNIGCGSIFVNYNGRIKQRTRVGSDCFIGSNVNLIAPLVISDGAYIAAGSTVTKNLNKNEFCIAREREYIKDDWKRK